jgi:phosphoribosyl-AMP cyclohydrolase
MSAGTPRFDSPNSLITAVVQDASSGKVLMLAHMNQAAWDETVATGYAVFFSRSRQQLWRKGETSGHVQKVREAYVDCDGDAVLLKVDQTGAACHEGYESCFFRRLDRDQWHVIAERLVDPAAVYSKSTSADA